MKKKIKFPKGYSEEQILNIVDGILDYLAPHFTFGYYDVDDIKQEGRIFALEVLSKCQPGRDIKNFLFTHIKNRLINLKRDKFIRPNPCTRCLYYQSDNLHGCSQHDNITNCPKYNKWIRKNNIKKNLIETHLDLVEQATDYRKSAEQLHDTELLKIVDTHLPLQYRDDFLRLIEGCSVTQFRRDKLMTEIANIIKQYYPEGYYEENEPKVNN